MFNSLGKRRERFWRELRAVAARPEPEVASFVKSAGDDAAVGGGGNASPKPVSSDPSSGFHYAIAPSSLVKPFRIAVTILGHDISRNLPSGHPMALELTELILAGLALRHGCSMLQIATFLPGMSSAKFRVRLTKALSDTDTSVWYFQILEEFSERFKDLRDRHGNRPADTFGNGHQDESRAAGMACLRPLPMMPVYKDG